MLGMEKLAAGHERWGLGWSGYSSLHLSQSRFLSHDMDRCTAVPREGEGDFVTGSENPEHTSSFSKPQAPLSPLAPRAALCGRSLWSKTTVTLSSTPSLLGCMMGGCGVGGPGARADPMCAQEPPQSPCADSRRTGQCLSGRVDTWTLTVWCARGGSHMNPHSLLGGGKLLERLLGRCQEGPPALQPPVHERQSILPLSHRVPAL